MQLKLSIFFLIRSLEIGGAERQLVILASALHARGHLVTVACMYGRGPLSKELEAAGVQVVYLGKRGRWDNIGFLFRLWSAARASGARLLHGYTPVPNLFLLVVKAALPGRKVVWGIRASMTDLRAYGRASDIVFRLSCRMSPLADLAIANSWRGAQDGSAAGLRPRSLVVVPNGIDVEHFTPDAEEGLRWREFLDVPRGAQVIGLVGRLDPAKDHESFIDAIALLRRSGVDALGICVGPGDQRVWDKLAARASSLGVAECVRWVGPTGRMSAVYNGIDVLCLPSISEGFPNVVAEAMACGRPCVVSDVGDSAKIVGKLGIVVPPRAPELLAEGLRAALASSDLDRQAARRRWIVDQYSVSVLLERTERVLATMCS